MKRYYTILILLAIMLVGRDAFAQEHVHSYCGVKNCSNDSHIHTEYSVWNGGKLELCYGNNYYYLGKSITTEEAIEIKAGITLYLCLNDKSIRHGDSFDLFRIYDGGKLIICNCGVKNSWLRAEGFKGKSLFIDRGGKVELHNSIIASSSEDDAIHNYGELQMYDVQATVSDSNSNNSGVVNYGTIIMSDGMIGGYFTSDPVVDNYGIFTINGGASISGSTSVIGVYNHLNATFSMLNAEIRGNSVGIQNEGTLNITCEGNAGNTSIYENSIGIFNKDNGIVNLMNGEICFNNNTGLLNYGYVTQEGGNIHSNDNGGIVNESGTYILNGSNGKTALIYNNGKNSAGAGAFISDGKLFISGNSGIYGNWSSGSNQVAGADIYVNKGKLVYDNTMFNGNGYIKYETKILLEENCAIECSGEFEKELLIANTAQNRNCERITFFKRTDRNVSETDLKCLALSGSPRYQIRINPDDNTEAEMYYAVNIRFDTNGGSGDMKSIDAVLNELLVIPPNEFVAPDGRVFAGWMINGKQYNTGDTIRLSDDIVLQAIWIPIEECESRIRQETLNDVPAGLKIQFENVDLLKDALLHEVLELNENSSNVLVEYYDIDLLLSVDEGKTWIEATEGCFSTEGMQIRLEYPAGTNGEDYDFTVIHMFTTDSDRLGTKAGEVEKPQMVLEEDSILLTLKGLSPVAVAWSEKEQIETDMPQTGDRSHIGVYTSIFLISIIIYNKLRKKKKLV